MLSFLLFLWFCGGDGKSEIRLCPAGGQSLRNKLCWLLFLSSVGLISRFQHIKYIWVYYIGGGVVHDLTLAVLALLIKLSHRSIIQAACYDLQLRFETVQSSGHAHNGNLGLAITASLLVCKSSSRCSINAECNCMNL